MTQIAPEETQEEPLDPAMEAVRRKMVRLQIVSGTVMFVSLMAVFGAVVYKAMGPSKTEAVATSSGLQVPADAPLAATASLPQGFVLEDVSLSGSQMLFYGALAGGTRKALVFDLTARRFVADVTIDGGK